MNFFVLKYRVVLEENAKTFRMAFVEQFFRRPDKPRLSHQLLTLFEKFTGIADMSGIMDGSSSNMIWISGSHLVERVHSNQAYLDFTGRTYEETLGDEWIRVLHPDDFQPFMELYSKNFNMRRDFKTEIRMLHYG